MRIIDKNTDFYDYHQGIDTEGELVFDRTDSFLLTKEIMSSYLKREEKWVYKVRQFVPKVPSYNYLLLQAGHKFWLFLVTIPEKKQDYTLSLIAAWSNYNRERALIKLDIISFSWSIIYQLTDKSSANSDIDINKLMERSDIAINAINTKDYKEVEHINSYSYYIGSDYNHKVTKHIPILKACGVANLIDPLEFYLAIDEYFSLEKQDSERIDAKGTTNNDKIKNHGFDTKTSFRGKAT